MFRKFGEVLHPDLNPHARFLVRNETDKQQDKPQQKSYL